MHTQFAPEWLALREDADAAARAEDLLEPLRSHLIPPLVVRDLGCGTGAMGRWLAPRLPGEQRWLLTDRDPALLAQAAGSLPVPAVAILRDLTDLTAADLAGASLVTASALLDLLTADEVDALAAACVAAGCPALLTLTVVGRVELEPADPLDANLTAAFNAHQRRTVTGRRLLGPDAADVAAAAFDRRGAVVHRRSSPWRLGPDRRELTARWLRGWVDAAEEQEPGLAVDAYLHRRLAACEAGELRATIHHEDLLALPG
ncbi:class I SAM-dependent methyltransferase [Actinophytocola gossypii]|uniref:Class I SAM-dependent methyltransferase n=1 Tax=Actinophytocola gossypii TaxID=2812003 RepID=A0ABT2J6E3_9PSEU|nr:class I SAM-dependent methyltransferase [Actinophytocola gossypii]MCT2583424.1 class I SAM-dependent methyltransferase [Actinophytocola gossypii]